MKRNNLQIIGNLEVKCDNLGCFEDREHPKDCFGCEDGDVLIRIEGDMYLLMKYNGDPKESSLNNYK